ncbi:MAG: AAA family ATPase [Halobacteriota archaeon]
MRVRSIELANYRCFEAAEVALEPGVTVIYGPNGAGKTTLFEAILFALYGSRGLADATLEDVVTRGAEEATVELTFDHGGTTYRLEREVAVHESRASTRRCVLSGDGGEPVEGARPVRERVRELLRMDAEAFVNSAYVKQGEIDRFLHASPAERQSMVDELLRLGVLEDYRDRADEARLAVRSLARERAERLEELDAQLSPLRERDPYDRLNELESERAQLRERLEEALERRDELRDERDDIVEELETLADRRREREELLADRSDVIDAIEAIEDDRTEVRERRLSRREERAAVADELVEALDGLELPEASELEAAREDLNDERERLEDEHESVRSTIEEARTRQAEAAERIDALEAQREERREELEAVAERIETDAEALAAREDERDDLEEELAALGADIEGWPLDAEGIEGRIEALESDLDELEADRRDRRERIAALEDHIERAESLAAAERCPTCGQPVDEAPHVERLEEDRAELESLASAVEARTDDIEAVEARLERLRTAAAHRNRLSNLEARIEERAAALAERHERRDDLEDRLGSIAADLEAASDRHEAATEAVAEARERLGELNAERERLRDREAAVDEAVALADRLAELDAERERLEERAEHLEALLDARHDRLDDIEDRLDDLADAVDDDRVASLEERRSALRSTLEELSAEVESLRSRRDELNEAIGSARTDREQLESLEERREAVVHERETLDALREEAGDLGALYQGVRAELRERNVAALERYLNETFELLYRNEAYDRIDLDPDYAITVYQHDGTGLDPDDLSGGERALFNLSLRWAIYRLLATGAEGTDPMPPLMLDEPTVFLDDGHVRRLLRLLETVRELGVEQALVVSHHETLLDAADQRLSVEKHPATNRSSVHAEVVAPGPP